MKRKDKEVKIKNPKNKKRIIVFLIIFFVIISACTGGFLYCKNKNISFSQIKERVFSKTNKSNTNSKISKQSKKKNKSTKNEIKIKKVDYTTYNWNGLNLRNKPDGTIIGAINKDSILIVSEEVSNSWLKVKVADKEGYVAIKYTKDKNGYFRESYKTSNLTKQCKKLINLYFTKEEQKILSDYEFRYIPNWIADCGAGNGYAITSFNTTKPKVIYFRDGTFKTATSHDEIILHELCHILFPENSNSLNSPFANRLKVAGYDAGIKKVPVHTSSKKTIFVSTGR